MSNMTQFQGNNAALPAVIQQAMQQMTGSELSQGVGANYAVVSIRGKVFRIKFGGVETPVMMQVPDGQGGTFQQPSAFLDVIIPRANGALSKTFYKNGFSEGSADQPDCWSEDGLTPLAPLDQRPLDMHTGAPCRDCRTCPMNQWGSKKTPAGKDIKACADTRKVAVVPAINITNDAFGGPMLLRVPGGSLGNLAEFDRAMQAKGFPYFAVVVRLSFDADPAHPKLLFTPIRVISNEEAASVMQLRDDPRTLTVLGAQQAGAAGGTAPEAPAQIQHQPVAPVAVSQAFAPPAQPENPTYAAPQQAFAPPTQPASPPQFAQPVPQQAPQQAFAQPVPQQVQVAYAPDGRAYNPATGELLPHLNQQPVQAAPVQQFTQPAEAPPPQAFTPPPQQAFTPPVPDAAFAPPQAPQQAFTPPAAPQAAFQQPAPQAAAPAATQGPQGGAAPAADPGLLASIDDLLGS